MRRELRASLFGEKTFPARFLHTYAGQKSRDIYDLGQNLSGILEFEVKGKAGDEVRIYPAEKLNAAGDTDQMAKGWLPIHTCVSCVIGENDTWETYRMTFTYAAGRYLAVEGASFCPQEDSGNAAVQDGKGPSSSPVQPLIRALRAHAITSAWQEAGYFACDDVRYLQIYDLVKKAVEANMLSVHTDCPTIERFAWQEPNHLMAPSIFYMKDGNALWRKFLRDLRAAQHTAADRFRDMDGNEFCPGEGLVPSQAPCYIPNVLPVPGTGSFYDIIAWGSTCILDGETTLGEYWETNPRSHCHDMMGHIIEWYYNGIGGIEPLEPGFRKIRVRPYLPESMHHADIAYSSASGDIHVHLERQADGSAAFAVVAAEGIEVVTDDRYCHQ